MNANQVTVLSVFFALMGGLLISTDSPLLILIGAVFFHIFAILDMSDGEVARYRGEGGVQGHYLDWFMHFITPTALVMGLFVASHEKLDSNLMIIIGLLAIVIPILSKSIQNAGWTVISWTYMRDKKNQNIDVEKMQKIISSHPRKRESSTPKWLRRLKSILLMPFEDRWSSLLILIFAILGGLFHIFNIEFIDYRLIWLIYMGIIGPMYIIYNVHVMIHSNALLDGYLRIADEKRKVSFPEDDFLG